MQDEVRREVERHDAVIGIGPVSLIRRRGGRSPVVVPEQDGSEEEEQNMSRRVSLTSCHLFLATMIPNLTGLLPALLERRKQVRFERSIDE
jgi:hypothetical protein